MVLEINGNRTQHILTLQRFLLYKNKIITGVKLTGIFYCLFIIQVYIVLEPLLFLHDCNQ